VLTAVDLASLCALFAISFTVISFTDEV